MKRWKKHRKTIWMGKVSMGLIVCLMLSAFLEPFTGCQVAAAAAPLPEEWEGDGYVDVDEDDSPIEVLYAPAMPDSVHAGETGGETDSGISADAADTVSANDASAARRPAARRSTAVTGSDERIFAEGEDEGAQLPASYDPRQSVSGNQLPPLRDQGSLEACWAFGITAAMELNLIIKGMSDRNVDLSERHLLYYFYNKGNTPDPLGNTGGDYNKVTNEAGENDYLGAGGNNLLTIWHLASRLGPVPESLAPYSGLLADRTADQNGLMGQANSTAMAYGSDAFCLQNAYIISIGTSYGSQTVRDKMKSMILEHGAINTGYYASSMYDVPANDCYFNYNYGKSTNHNIAIVGWDDSFSKDLFAQDHQPDSDGAWLVRNSYGEESDKKAQDGYFWMSYQDYGLRAVSGGSGKYAVALDLSQAGRYDNLYQYDGNADYRRFPEEPKSAGAIFTARTKGGERLSAVGLGVMSEGVDYTLQIYTDVEEGKPDSGTLAATQTGEVTYAGYHTIELADPVTLHEGQTYAIVFSQLEKKSDASRPILLSACTEQRNLKSGYTWDFVSDTTGDKTYFQNDTDNLWHDAADMMTGYLDGNTSGSADEKAFEKGSVEESRITKVIRSDYTLRIKGYTENLDENETAGGETQPGQDAKEDTSKEEKDQSNQGGSADTSGGKVQPGQDTPKDTSKDETICRSLTLDKTEAVVTAGEECRLVASALSLSGRAESDVIWQSSDSLVAEVTDYGRIITKKAGKVTIKATCDQMSAQFHLTVLPKATAFTRVKLSGKTLKTAKVTLKWKKTPDADGYILYRSTYRSRGFKVYRVLQGNASLGGKYQTLYKKKPYYFKVASYKTAADGTRLVSELSDAGCIVPDVQEFSGRALTGHKNKLTWKTAGVKTGGYGILRSQKPFGGYKTIARIGGSGKKSFSLKDKGLKKGKTYYYRIRTYVLIGKTRIWGRSMSAIAVKAR